MRTLTNTSFFVLSLLALPLVAGCGSNEPAEEPRGNDTGRVAKLDEVPESYRKAWADWLQSGEVWAAARDEALSDPDRRQALIDNWIIVMGRFYSGRAMAQRGQMPGPFKRAQHELVALGVESAPSLIELVRAGDEVAATLAADTIDLMKEPRVCVMVLPLLEDPREASRRRGANLLARMPHAKSDEPAVREALGRLATDDPEWTVRAQSTRALGQRGLNANVLEPTRILLVRCLNDPDPAVYEAACRGLGQLGDIWAIPPLIAHLEALLRRDVRPAGPRAAQDALQQLSGVYQSWSPLEWERWWRAEGFKRASRAGSGARQ